MLTAPERRTSRPERHGATRLRRLLLALAAAAGTWALLLLPFGGVSFQAGPIRVSSRSPVNPGLIALVCAAAAWMLAPGGDRFGAVAGDIRRAAALLPRWAPVERIAGRIATFDRLSSRMAALLAALAAAGAIAIGASEGAFVAGGSDSYGYISEAHLFATGHLRAEQPLAGQLPQLRPQIFTPLGYVVSPGDHAAAPQYAPGLPIVMALFELAGGRRAVYAVVPLLAAVAVWVTYWMGAQLGAAGAGLGAAFLLLLSPTFLFQLTSAPMSDIPATAWWAIAIAMAIARRQRPLASGIAAGLAILTRPNLAPLALVPAVALLANGIRGGMRGNGIRSAALFCAGVVPACVIVAALNTVWYGGPLASGYEVQGLFAWRFASDNLAHYPRWLLETETPLVLLAVLSPMLLVVPASAEARRSRIAALLATIAVVYAAYAFYMLFDAWWFLRFLLPAFPALFLLQLMTVAALTRRLPPLARAVIGIAVVAIVAWHGWRYASDRGVFDTRGELRYATVGNYVARTLPANAVVLATQHSGSIRYYSERPIVRFDLLDAPLDDVLDELERLGYHPYAALDGFEQPAFRQLFAARSGRGALDWPASAHLDVGDVGIWDLSQAAVAGRAGIRTAVIASR